MPIITTLLGIGAAAVGVGAHLSAKETNEQAKKTFERAQDMYNEEKSALEAAQKTTEKALLRLGNSKKNVMETSMKQFITVFSRVKAIEVQDSPGMDEISNFTLSEQDVLEIKQMTNIHKSMISSSAAGAATGTVIALATSGAMPVVTGALSSAGAAFVAGNIGAATGLATSALSFSAAITPLGAIAAPVLLFTGISSGMKAEENLEKAGVMYHKAKRAVEKMKTAETLCNGITEKADMFNNLLKELNRLFSQCVVLLDAVTKKKMGLFGLMRVNYNKLSKEEKALLGVTAALAKAVKSVINTPLLNKDGSISDSPDQVANGINNQLPAYNKNIATIKNSDYNISNSSDRFFINIDYSKNSKNSIIAICAVVCVVIAVVALIIINASKNESASDLDSEYYSGEYAEYDDEDMTENLLITPGEYRCYSFSTGRGSFESDDFKRKNSITLYVYSDNTASMECNLYWDDGDHEKKLYDLTYDDTAFYTDGDIFCNYQFNENNMHLDLWYMDFQTYSFVIEEYYY